jgi:hypothetical protein
MSADRHLSHEEDRVNVKRKGLRIALAVAVGFSWLVYSGAIIPFLGPLFAAQFLISSSRPMPVQKALAVTVLILVVGALLQFVTVLTGDRPLAAPLAERSDFHARRASGCYECHKRERRQEILHHCGHHTARRSRRK